MDIEKLSPREVTVLKLIADGKLSKQIAYDLGITQRTVAFHKERIKRKLRQNNSASMVRYAIQHGIID